MAAHFHLISNLNLTMIPREEGVEEGGLEGQGGQGGPSIVLDSAKRVYLRAFLREVSDGDPKNLFAIQSQEKYFYVDKLGSEISAKKYSEYRE